MSENRLTLWMFDFDGTLSTLVADRTAAKLEPNCRKMLCRLSAIEGFLCAILSSRRLSDLDGRVNIAGIYLGGSSGLEWKLPGGQHIAPEKKWVDSLKLARKSILPELTEFSRLRGFEFEDKYWSVAIHTRHAPKAAKKDLVHYARWWRKVWGIACHGGPEVIEVQLMPQIDKSHGVRTFCDHVGFRPGFDGLFYAGDDENDAAAMNAVRVRRGQAVSVGSTAVVPFARVVSSPTELAKYVEALSGLSSAPGSPLGVAVKTNGERPNADE